MPVHLYVAPAAHGKTSYALNRVREAAASLAHTPRLIVPSLLHLRACRRRLAEAGGSIGVRLLTFDRLYAACLNAAGEVYTQLSEPVQYRLIRSVIDHVHLVHYSSLVDRPGFVQVLQALIGELKAARVWPDDFEHAVQVLGNAPRLRELAQVYAAYQERLRAKGWADWAGMAWLAVEALEQRAREVGRDWPLLLVDGFDDFTEVQIALLRVLAGRVREMVLTLTGTIEGGGRPLVHRRFQRTLERLQDALSVQAEPLPDARPFLTPALAHLEANLYRSKAKPQEADDAVELLEASDRAGEVRAALRWLKKRVVLDQLHPKDVALLARDMARYRPYVLQTGVEFGLPVRLAGGLPLASNPAISGLMDLLRLMLPGKAGDSEPALPRRLVIEAWRSPYFDWSALPTAEAEHAVGIGPGDADKLDEAARWGRVIGGLAQWTEALDALAQRSVVHEEDDEWRDTAGAPAAKEAEELRRKFLRFLDRLDPPSEGAVRDHVRWLEQLIGDDPETDRRRFPHQDDATSLRVVERVRAAATSALLAPMVDRDIAALRALKDVLRGLVWADEAVPRPEPLSFASFFRDLEGALQAATYRLSLDAEADEVLVADVVQARAVSFSAVAILGLAEGEFPARLSEDAFLTDADRVRLSTELGCTLSPSLESAEAEYFYSAVTRGRDRVLLTRPRLAENGAVWQPSPYWEQVRKCLHVQVRTQISGASTSLTEVASWPELMESLATRRGAAGLPRWAGKDGPKRWASVEASAAILSARTSSNPRGPFAGDLSTLHSELHERYGPEHVWSASRLEAYRACPFLFFVGSVLKLEPREEPAEGLDARQLGNIYHHLFEQLYDRAQDPSVLNELLALLPAVANDVLDKAPEQEGFRVTAWWEHTRKEIEENVDASLRALHGPQIQQGFVSISHEERFWEPHELRVTEGDDCFRLHGYIDRVEKTDDGCLRIIDYKTGSKSTYGAPALEKGKKIQLPLYALAAWKALDLGMPYDGFYWHVRQAEPSGLTLSKFGKGDPQVAMDTAVVKAWEAVRGVRGGVFGPQPPDTGCPPYCPAAEFCERYQRTYWG